VVSRARDTRLGRVVALKILPTDAVTKPDRKLRFIQEARSAPGLNRPNIVTVYVFDSSVAFSHIWINPVTAHASGRTARIGLQLLHTYRWRAQADAVTRGDR
jgi:hypothetical protein